ncbi:MAG: hypothetical protein ACKO92_04620, partial [Actinomycetota bacterium]
MSTTANALGAGPKMIVRRPILVLAGLLSTVSAMVMGSMLAIWLDFRSNAPLRESTDGTKMLRDWLPAHIPLPSLSTPPLLLPFFLPFFLSPFLSSSL